MDNLTYAREAIKTAPKARVIDSIDQSALLLGALGASDEAGEIAGLVKKHVFHGHPLDMNHLMKEIGDVLWYLNYLASLGGKTLGDVMDLNIEKLAARYPEGFFSSHRSLNRREGDI